MRKASTLDFRTTEPQTYVDPWRGNKERICQYKGKCVVCMSRLYAFDDGENDPRGALTEKHSWNPCDFTFGKKTVEVPMCFSCANTEHLYRIAEGVAKRKAKAI